LRTGAAHRVRHAVVVLVGALALVPATLTGLSALAPSTASAAPAAQDWPTYLHDNARSSGTTDPSLSLATVGQLQLDWAAQTGGPIATSASIVGTTAYVGSWDGNEYAINTGTGTVLWKTNLGITTDPGCNPSTIGITSAATVLNGVVYVGGGGPNWYALDATTGAILWSVYTGDNSQAGAHYNWSSPLIVNGYAYVGIASNCDNPLVQGQLLKVSLASGSIVATYNFVPNGQVGGGIWTSPTYDPATNRIFVSTGTLAGYTQTQSQAIVALDAGTLAYDDSWQLPFGASIADSDWSTTPTLTTDAQGDQLLSVSNKNGVLYTFNRNNLAAGPVWQRAIAIGGTCPTCGDGILPSAIFVNNVLFAGGGHTATGSQGSISAIDAGTGNVLWTRPTDQPILGSPAYVNGMIAEVEGSTFEVLNAITGALVYSYVLPAAVYGGISVAQGQFYVGAVDGKLYAFGAGPAPATPPVDANCPAGFTCQDIHGPAKGSESTAAGTLTVTAAGTGIKGTGDQFRLLARSVSGDSQASVTVTGQTPQAGLTQQAGLMVRQSAVMNSPFYAVLAYPNDTPPDVQVWARSSFGKNPVQLAKVPLAAPASLMVQRAGNQFSAGLSTDGVSYQLVPGSTSGLDLPATSLEGLAVSSGSAKAYGTASFTALSVGGAPNTTLAPAGPADLCPGGWTCADIGNPSPLGDTTASGSSLTLAGTGSGFLGSSDSMHYVYQSVSGPSSLSARVVTQPGASAKAQEGLLVRAGSSPSAPEYGVSLHPGGSAAIRWRVNDGIALNHTLPLATSVSPAYLRIVVWPDTRANPTQITLSTFTSTDGVTWTPVLGSTQVVPLGPTYLAGLAASSGVNGSTVPVVFDHLAVAAVSTPPPGVCPTGWSCADIGGPGVPAGNQLVNGGSWTVQGSGDIWSVYDEFRFEYQPFAPSANGDGTISARVTSQGGGGPWMRSGVMIRSGTDAQAPYYGVFLTPSNGVAVQWRASQAAQTQQVAEAGLVAPQYVEAARYTDPASGNVVYAAYSSTDGVTWTYVPNSQVALTLPGPLVAGLASDANSSLNLTVATFDSVVQQATEQAPPLLCPSGWSCNDIGGALPPGQDSVVNGSWTETAGGGDIWGTADAFHLVAEPLAADGTVTAHVTSQQTTNAWAKAGVMVRATTDPGSPYYGVFATPGNGVAVQWRATQGGASTQVLASGTLPVYLRVARFTTSGSNPQTYYTAYTSPDGTTWTAVPGSTVVLAVPGTLLAGLALTSHAQGVGGTVTFDSVAVTPGEVPPPAFVCPAGWTCGDIGTASPAGSQNLSGGTWTIQGGGADIFGTADAFHFAWQSLAGDGSLSTRAVSLSSPSAWAKAGPMLRATTDPGSAYYAAFATPGNGVAVQWRASAGGSTGQVTVAGVAPVYLRVTRTGTAFAAATSPDGVTWTTVPGSAMTLANLSGPLLRGLAVTSHSNGKAGTVVFDSVVGTP
jgi:outer membrane protein assembly factor BamB